MKISLDGGALCSDRDLRFGTYTFSRNLIETISRFNRKQNYIVYSFCSKPSWLKTSKKCSYKLLLPSYLWSSLRLGIEELLEKKDVFLGLNQAIPFVTRSRVISFCHGLSYHYYPLLYLNSYRRLKRQLAFMLQGSEKIIVSSQKVKKELKELSPHTREIETIPFGIPYDMVEYKILKREKYFVFVGMDHPVKNISFLIRAFQTFRKSSGNRGYKLYLVGNLEPYEDKLNNIYVLRAPSRAVIKILYAKAAGYLTSSFYESFNLPVLEALAQKCPVVGLRSALIPELLPYVRVAEELEDFVYEMTQVAEGKIILYTLDELTRRFSWKNYYKKLEDLIKR